MAQTLTKWWLLVVSGVTLVTLIAMALHEGVFTEWRAVQEQYRQILKDKKGKGDDSFIIAIRQHVLPELDTIDRCITCHPGIEDPRMADQPQPFRTHPGNYLQHHPPEKFGCTVCHRGQGRSLVFAEAKAEGYHWNYPFLPREFLEAECGRCHARLPYATPKITREGDRLIRREGCVECHDLKLIGLRLIGRKWWKGHPKQAITRLTDQERNTLQNYLITQHGAPKLAHGQRLFAQHGCCGCHKIGKSGGVMGPDLTREGRKTKHEFSFAGIQGEKSVPNWLYEHFLDPARVVPDSKMPRQQLTRTEARALTTYLLSLRQTEDLAQQYIPVDARNADFRERPEGRILFSLYCSGCHGKRGQGAAYTAFGRSVPGILNPDFLRIAQPDYIRHVASEGRSYRDMPTWKFGMDRALLEAILGYIESQRIKPRPYDGSLGNNEKGHHVFQEYCAGCHGVQGEGDIGPQLNAATFLDVTDNHSLYTIITQGRPHSAMPAWADLSDGELSGLIGLFASWREDPLSDDRPPFEYKVQEQGDPIKGQNTFTQYCAGCHGPKGINGVAPAIGDKRLLEAVSDGYLIATLVLGRSNTIMLPRGLNAPGNLPPLNNQDILDIVSFLRLGVKP